MSPAKAAEDDLAVLADHSGPRAQIAQGEVRRGEPGFRALYTMDRDGTHVEYLTAAPGMISSAAPAYSHDGKYVACDTCPKIDDVGAGKVFVVALDGPFQGMALDMGYGNTPSWSPDDRQIAFMLNGGNPIDARGGVWLMKADGTRRRWLSDGWYPRWSPDGKTICCHDTLSDGREGLVLVDVTTHARRPLLTARGWELLDYGGTWSPDGRRIVFAGSFQGRDRLATISVDPDDPLPRILYTNDDATAQLIGPPAWSPDGRQIVFAIQPKERGPRQWWKSYLYSLAADVPSAPALLEGRVGNINRGMSWSPDSKKVIFSSER
jgi:Tol biopolymer transport system component